MRHRQYLERTEYNPAGGPVPPGVERWKCRCGQAVMGDHKRCAEYIEWHLSRVPEPQEAKS